MMMEKKINEKDKLNECKFVNLNSNFLFSQRNITSSFLNSLCFYFLETLLIFWVVFWVCIFLKFTSIFAVYFPISLVSVFLTQFPLVLLHFFKKILLSLIWIFSNFNFLKIYFLQLQFSSFFSWSFSKIIVINWGAKFVIEYLLIWLNVSW